MVQVHHWTWVTLWKDRFSIGASFCSLVNFQSKLIHWAIIFTSLCYQIKPRNWMIQVHHWTWVSLHFVFPNLVKCGISQLVRNLIWRCRRQYIHKGFASKLQQLHFISSSSVDNDRHFRGGSIFSPRGPSRILNHKPWKCIPCDIHPLKCQPYDCASALLFYILTCNWLCVQSLEVFTTFISSKQILRRVFCKSFCTVQSLNLVSEQSQRDACSRNLTVWDWSFQQLL